MTHDRHKVHDGEAPTGASGTKVLGRFAPDGRASLLAEAADQDAYAATKPEEERHNR